MERREDFPLLLEDHHGICYIVSEERLPGFFLEHADEFEILYYTEEGDDKLRLLHQRAVETLTTHAILKFLLEWSAWTDELLRLRSQVNVL